MRMTPNETPRRSKKRPVATSSEIRQPTSAKRSNGRRRSANVLRELNSTPVQANDQKAPASADASGSESNELPSDLSSSARAIGRDGGDEISVVGVLTPSVGSSSFESSSARHSSRLAVKNEVLDTAIDVKPDFKVLSSAGASSKSSRSGRLTRNSTVKKEDPDEVSELKVDLKVNIPRSSQKKARSVIDEASFAEAHKRAEWYQAPVDAPIGVALFGSTDSIGQEVTRMFKERVSEICGDRRVRSSDFKLTGSFKLTWMDPNGREQSQTVEELLQSNLLGDSEFVFASRGHGYAAKWLHMPPRDQKDEYDSAFAFEGILAKWKDGSVMVNGTKKKTDLWFVKWDNYPHSVNTWESTAHLHGVDNEVFYAKNFDRKTTKSEMIEDFERRDKLISRFRDEMKKKLGRNFDDLYKCPYNTLDRGTRLLEQRCFDFEVRLNAKLADGEAPIYVENWTECGKEPPADLELISKMVYEEGQSDANLEKEVKGECPDGCTMDVCSDECPCLKKLTNLRVTNGATRFTREVDGQELYEFCGMCTARSHYAVNGKPLFTRTCPLLLFYIDSTKGWGVFTLDSMKEDSYLGRYLGLLKKAPTAKKYVFEVFRSYGRSNQKFYVDAKKYGNLNRHINHACGDYANLVATHEYNNALYHTTIAFFTRKEIKFGEELTFNYYGSNLSTNRGGSQCLCHPGCQTML